MTKCAVWKFEVPHEERHALVDMPAGPWTLGAEVQDDKLFVWALVDPDAPKVPVAFTVVATGDELSLPDGPPGLPSPMPWHVGTVRYKAMVLHVFRGKL